MASLGRFSRVRARPLVLSGLGARGALKTTPECAQRRARDRDLWAPLGCLGLPAALPHRIVIDLQCHRRKLLIRRRGHNIEGRTWKHLSKTFREERFVGIIDSNTERTGLSSDPIINEGNRVVGSVAHKCIGPFQCVRGDEQRGLVGIAMVGASLRRTKWRILKYAKL